MNQAEITNQNSLEEIIYCTTGCGSNADPADGFGYCTCGAEEKRKGVLAWHQQQTTKEMLEIVANAGAQVTLNSDNLTDIITTIEALKADIRQAIQAREEQ